MRLGRWLGARVSNRFEPGRSDLVWRDVGLSEGQWEGEGDFGLEGGW